MAFCDHRMLCRLAARLHRCVFRARSLDWVGPAPSPVRAARLPSRLPGNITCVVRLVARFSALMFGASTRSTICRAQSVSLSASQLSVVVTVTWCVAVDCASSGLRATRANPSYGSVVAVLPAEPQCHLRR